MKSSAILLAMLCSALGLSGAEQKPSPLPTGEQTDGQFRKVILDSDKDIDADGKVDDSLKDPMELSVAWDGRVYFAQRDGTVKVWSPKDKASTEVGKLDVFTGLEDGLLGLTLDPNFKKNGWIYLFYAAPETTSDKNGKKAGENRVARFTVKNEKLDLKSEKVLIRIATQREECCHSGGSLNFDSEGNLYASVGDNTNPFASDGFSPSDEQPGRSPWDAQKSSANPNDLRGKVLRVTPKNNGTIKIPKGNLFPEGTAKTRPEIFTMGCRNPFRISIDQKNQFLYWGDVGPDAMGFVEGRGPAGHDEINQARKAGFFGWPYFVGDNKAYWDYDFATKKSGERFDAAAPMNNSPNNTGIQALPPAQPAMIYYPHSASAKFPVLNAGGGRTAMAGPVYYFDPKAKSETKMPKEFDHTLFIYEWSRNWVMAVQLDGDEKSSKIERFCPGITFKRPMDMELGPDGCLYVIEFGTAWGNNLDTQIVRIEFVGGKN